MNEFSRADQKADVTGHKGHQICPIKNTHCINAIISTIYMTIFVIFIEKGLTLYATINILASANDNSPYCPAIVWAPY